jgi:hypothetical protein
MTLLLWLLALTQIPALRALARYVPLPELALPALLLLAAAAFAVLFNPPQRLRTVLFTPWPSLLVVVLLSLAIAYVYPLADGLKTLGGGSDADDALQLGGVALWHLANPYALTTYFGNPLSPGPGWLALYGPLALLGLQPLGTVGALCFAIWALRRVKISWPILNLLTLGWASSLAVWELAAVGNDLPSFGLVLLGVLALLAQPRLSFNALLLLAVVVGCLATARISFFYLPLLLGFALLAVWPKRALWVALLGFATMALWHGSFFILNPQAYPPLHLLVRGETLISGAAWAGVFGVLGVTGVAMLYHWRWWNPYVHTALGLGVPLGVLATAELASHGSLAAWEGATWLTPALPVACMAVLTVWPLPRALAQSVGARPHTLPVKKAISVSKNQKAKRPPLAKGQRSR